jgi:hypothetical protein
MPKTVKIVIVAIAVALGAGGGQWLADYAYMRYYVPTIPCNDIGTPGLARLAACAMPTTPQWTLLCGVLLGALLLGTVATWTLRAQHRHSAATWEPRRPGR